MVAGARIVWDSATSSTLPNFDRNRRITYALTDLLQTSGAVVDLVSGELLELSTYYPNGARENLWASDSNAPLEPMGFTGKEADEEIGLTYFGERWLMPRLGIWASLDPLHVHASGGEGSVGVVWTIRRSGVYRGVRSEHRRRPFEFTWSGCPSRDPGES